MDDRPKKTIQINPDFLKLPLKGNRSRKNRDNSETPKPIKIRTEKKTDDNKTIKRRAINYIRKQQEARYKRLMNGTDESANTNIPATNSDPKKTYADEFKSDFDDSLSFLQKLADQNAQKTAVNQTLKQYPVLPNSTLFNNPILNTILDENVSLVEPDVFQDVASAAGVASSILNPSLVPLVSNFRIAPPPAYGCLKNGRLPTYRTYRNLHGGSSYLSPVGSSNLSPVGSSSLSPVGSSSLAQTAGSSSLAQTAGSQSLAQTAGSQSLAQTAGSQSLAQTAGSQSLAKLSPEQQRAELKHFLENRKEEKKRIERAKKQHYALKPNKKQKRTTTRTFRVGKSKHYSQIGVLIPNKTIRNQVLAKKQLIRECPIEDVRKYLIKKGLIRVGSSCPNDVLRKMYESSMLMCGEIQNHNADNLLYNYLHNAF
jgi:hypothetical protein